MLRLLSTALLMIAFVLPALAQADSAPNRSDFAWRAIEAQMAQTLATGDGDTQNAQLVNVIALSTLYRGKVDFSQSVPAITAIHRKAESETLRYRAVAALLAIDSSQSRRYLARHVDDNEVQASRIALLQVLETIPATGPLARH